MLKPLISFFFICSLLFAQVEHSGTGDRVDYLPDFYIDLAAYKSTFENKTRIDIFLQVPYSNVQFIKSAEGYIAKYSVTLTFYDDDKENIVFERIWDEKIIVPEFEETYSKQNFNISYKSFDLAPGTYNAVCIVEDLDSKKRATYQLTIEVKSFEKEVELSDIVFVQEKIVKDGEESIIANVSHIVTSKVKELPFFYEIYTTVPGTVLITYIVEDKAQEKSYTMMENRILKSNRELINYTIKNIPFTLGDFELTISIKNEDGTFLDSNNKTFKSIIYGFPASIKDLDKATEQLIYIATTAEIDSIKEAKNYEEKLNRFKYFWQLKDPSPNTIENEILIEYYRRVAYSNQHFKSFFDGWRSDMGMIYITLGPPNQVERQPVAVESKPYEIWEYYNINRTFVFVDQTGFGDYRLINPQYGDWNRYRQ